MAAESNGRPPAIKSPDLATRLDLSLFAEERFEPADWLRRASAECKVPQDRPEPLEFLVNALSKLQSLIQRVNASLEEESQSTMNIMPKIIRDGQWLQSEAEKLNGRMAFLRQEFDKMEIGADCPLSLLEELDKTKEALIAQTESLKEADNWTTLANEVEEVFESGDVQQVALKLVGMQKSLSMLSNAPDYEHKKMQLEGLKNRLEALVSPQLVQAFTAENLEQSMVFVDIFSKMDRLPQLLKYYENCLKVSLAQEWRKIIEYSPDDNVAAWIKSYFDKLISVWEVQGKWIKHVFNLSPTEALVTVYSDLLSSLEPSILECTEAALKQQENTVKLSILVDLKIAADLFVSNIKRLEETISQAKIPEDKLFTLLSAVFAPFVALIPKYVTYESSQLNQLLTSLELISDDLSDTISLLGISIPKVFNFMSEANDRCKQFTEGCGYPGFVGAIDDFLVNYSEKFKSPMRPLNKRKVKHEDWNLFQICLTLMQILGKLLFHIEELEEQLYADVLLIIDKLQSHFENTSQQYISIFLTSNDQKKFQDFVAKMKQDRSSILDNSKKSVKKICTDVHRSTLEVIFAPIFTHLLQIRKSPIWTGNYSGAGGSVTSNLPDFSFAPQEYITQIGQYLMTLPQHLEPFLFRDNPDLTKALKAADSQYNKESGESVFTNILLEIIAKDTCQMFQDQTWGIYELNVSACKQLATDIDYLGNILEELGLCLSENLQQMSLLLRLPAEDYQSKSSGCNARVVAAVRQMRNIQSSG